MPIRLVLPVAIFCLIPVFAVGAPRTWHDDSGKFSIEAELIELDSDEVVLKRADGSLIMVPLKRLGTADRRYLESLNKTAAPPTDSKLNQQITDLMKQVQEQSNVPALVGAIVTSEGLHSFGVAGVRKRGETQPVTLGDLWHLGSNTKAMTATLVAKLVEQGRLDWETTIAEVFSDASFKIHPDFQKVTMMQLLAHRSGLPPNLKLPNYLGKTARRERLRAVKEELAKPPQFQPGSQYQYSNLGYLIVGAMIEKITNKSWQANMTEHVFRPLKMNSAGFGGTGTPGKLDQPWSHLEDGSPLPLNGPTLDNPPVMGPAGRVHCTIQDWSKYVADVLRGLAGKPAMLQTATYDKLTAPPYGGDYALGWIVTERDWAGGKVLQHSGSNTMNFATVWIAPEGDFAFLACTNQGGEAARAACDTAVVMLIQHYSTITGR